MLTDIRHEAGVGAETVCKRQPEPVCKKNIARKYIYIVLVSGIGREIHIYIAFPSGLQHKK